MVETESRPCASALSCPPPPATNSSMGSPTATPAATVSVTSPSSASSSFTHGGSPGEGPRVMPPGSTCAASAPERSARDQSTESEPEASESVSGIPAMISSQSSRPTAGAGSAGEVTVSFVGSSLTIRVSQPAASSARRRRSTSPCSFASTSSGLMSGSDAWPARMAPSGPRASCGSSAMTVVSRTTGRRSATRLPATEASSRVAARLVITPSSSNTRWPSGKRRARNSQTRRSSRSAPSEAPSVATSPAETSGTAARSQSPAMPSRSPAACAMACCAPVAASCTLPKAASATACSRARSARDTPARSVSTSACARPPRSQPIDPSSPTSADGLRTARSSGRKKSRRSAASSAASAVASSEVWSLTRSCPSWTRPRARRQPASGDRAPWR